MFNRKIASLTIGLMLSCSPEVFAAVGEADGACLKIQTIKISNPACEAEILVKPFVHLISFRLTGGKNHLINFESPNPLRDGHPMRPLYVVGAKLWYAPEVPSSHLFGMLSGAITQARRTVDAQLDPDPTSGLRGHILFVLDDHQPCLTITSIIQNVGTAEKEASCWWPVSFEPGGRMEAKPMPLPTDPAFSFHFWSYDGADIEPACTISAKKIVLDLNRPRKEPLFKVGFLGKEVLLTEPDCAYRLSVLDPLPGPQWSYPHGGSPVMFYSDQRTLFCEAELSGPLTRMLPGEKTTFTFSISLEAPAK